MSDQWERRSADGDVRDRLARVEVAVNNFGPEITKLRETVHPLVSSVTAFTLSTEDANAARQEVTRGLRALTDRVTDSALASARAEAAYGATFVAHVEQCKTDKAEQKTLIQKLGADRERMHLENQNKLEEMSQEFRDYFWAAVKWIAGIGGTLIVGLVGLTAYLLINGVPWQAHH